MNPDEMRQLLTEIRDTNRQLVEVQQQIAQSFSRIEEMWANQMRTAAPMMRWSKYIWVFALIFPLLMLIPMFWNMWFK